MVLGSNVFEGPNLISLAAGVTSALGGGASSWPRVLEGSGLFRPHVRRPPTVDPEWASQNPEEAQAQLIDARRADFESRYRPLEQAAIAEFMKSPEEAASRAQGISTSAFGRVSAMADRSLGRRGVSMTADQAAAAQAATDLDRVRAGATGANLTRRHVTDRNIEGLGTMVGIGRGIQGAGLSGMDDASAMANARNEAGKAARQQHRQARTQAVMQLGATALLAFGV